MDNVIIIDIENHQIQNYNDLINNEKNCKLNINNNNNNTNLKINNDKINQILIKR